MSGAPVDSKVAYRQITKRVNLDKSTLTYRVLSRELGITVKQAKQFLHDYFLDPTNAERPSSPTWALSGILKPQPMKRNQDEMDVDDDVADSTPSTSSQVTATVPRRTVMLVPDAELASKTELFMAAPTKHIYALSPSPLPTLAALSSYQLSSATEASIEKWKKQPEGGYGGILHPEGEKRKSTTVAPTKGGTGKTGVKKVEEKKAPMASGSGSSSKASDTASTSNGGSIKGMFAKATANQSNVPAKRKASPVKEKEKEKEKPKKTTQNGIFADEEVSDDEFGDDGLDDEGMDELLRIQEAEEKKASSGAKMEVDKKSTTKPAPAKTAPSKPVAAPAKKSTGQPGAKPGTLNAFFKKKA
ncbi:hypothetical protein T439DRAFT_321722 [Meredithblackwellia eburnea MCA 4105]